jgi:hypothetical protein
MIRQTHVRFVIKRGNEYKAHGTSWTSEISKAYLFDEKPEIVPVGLKVASVSITLEELPYEIA